MIPSDIGLPSKFTLFRSEVKQEETILSLVSSQHRASLVSAPPGSGKTLIAVASAILSGYRTLYLTVTKAQSQQVYNDFSSIGLFDIKGHVNYSCARTGGRGISYDPSSSDFDFECSARDDGTICFYRDDIETSLTRNLVSTNIAHWVNILKSDDPNRLGHFDLIILDEAHEIVNKMTDYLSVSISPRNISHYLDMRVIADSEPMHKWCIWVKEVVGKLRTCISRKRSVNDESLTKRDMMLLIKLEKDLQRFLFYCDDTEWVSELDYKTKNINLKPVWTASLNDQYLFNGISRIIAVSATINEDTARYLGIDCRSQEQIRSDSKETDKIDLPYDYIEVDSSFPKERRPFIYVPTTLVDYKMTEGQKVILHNQFDRVISARLDRKGAIQAGSYDRGAEVESRSEYGSLFITDTKYTVTQELLRKFIASSPPCIFNSPAIEEGIDLADDICRYQIIPKMPQIDGRGKVVAARVKSDRKYKLHVMSQRLEQMYGRPTRSSLDWSETFIFDDYFYRLRKQVNWHKWFRESWVQYRAVPGPINF